MRGSPSKRVFLTRPLASVGLTDPSHIASPTGRGPSVQNVSRAPLRVALSTRRALLCLTSPPGSPGLNEVNTGHFWADGLGGLRAGSQGEDCRSVAVSTRTGVLLTQLHGGRSSREAQHCPPSAPRSLCSALSRLCPPGLKAPTLGGLGSHLGSTSHPRSAQPALHTCQKGSRLLRS